MRMLVVYGISSEHVTVFVSDSATYMVKTYPAHISLLCENSM